MAFSISLEPKVAAERRIRLSSKFSALLLDGRNQGVCDAIFVWHLHFLQTKVYQVVSSDHDHNTAVLPKGSVVG